VSCDAVSPVPDVTVEANGNAPELIQPLPLDPEHAARVLGDHRAFAGFVAEQHDLGSVVHRLHIASSTSPVRGVPTIVLPGSEMPHGKVNAGVTAEIEGIAGIPSSSGLSVEVVCTDGDSA
jgi:hypothetical protein